MIWGFALHGKPAGRRTARLASRLAATCGHGGNTRMRRPTTIAPAKGTLGVLTVGMGAVATTFMAGVELVRKKMGRPVGSLTQMGTIRLGKRTEGRTPLIRDFVSLAGLDDLVFGGWDVFPDSAYEAAAHARSEERR